MDSQLAPPELSEPGPLHCCCKGEDCVALIHNLTVVDGLNKDARNAAQLGQVCFPYSKTMNAADRPEPPRPPQCLRS